MTRSNSGEALHRKKYALIPVIALALMLGGCAFENEPAVYANATEETTSVRTESSSSETETVTEAVTETSEEPVTTTPPISSSEATSAETPVTTSVTTVTAPETTAVPETAAETIPAATGENIPLNTEIGSDIPAVAITAVTTETSAQSEQTAGQASANLQTVSTDYSKEFFESDLFIGDSISTGYSLYGFLPEKNVYAKVGLNPSTVLTRTVATCYGEIGISDMLAYTSPERVYIMLGSNGVQWLSVANMLDSTDTLTELIKDSCPDAEVVIVSVPPVTPEYDATVDDVNVMAKINEYNDGLSAYCRAKGMLYIDIASVLKNEYGYFDYTYAESDGMHFKSSAYKVILSKIQSEVTDYLDYKEQAALRRAEAEAADGSETVTVTDITSASAASETETATETGVTEAAVTEKTAAEATEAISAVTEETAAEAAITKTAETEKSADIIPWATEASAAKAVINKNADK